MVCERPSEIHRELTDPSRTRGWGSHRLHCEDGPAVVWPDGWGVWSWHGVQVPRKLIESPETITRDDVVHETNVEVRRAMMEILGPRFAELLGAEEVAREEFLGQEYVLLRTVEIDPDVGDRIQWVKVTCPSTGHEYTLCVPPDVTSPVEAVAWTFGTEAARYRPVVQT